MRVFKYQICAVIPKFNIVVICEFDFSLYFKIFQDLKVLFLFLILNFPESPKGTVMLSQAIWGTLSVKFGVHFFRISTRNFVLDFPEL